MNTNNRLIFLHLPKNAGTTLNSILKKSYNPSEIYQVGYDENKVWNFNKFKNLSQKERDNVKLLTGHFNFGVHELFTNDYAYLTMLRHPIERTISFYNYVKRKKEHRILDLVKNKSLIECVTQIKDFDVVNGQARKLSNCDDENLMLKKALANIDSQFEFVGIQEYFEESILLLNNVLKLNILYYKNLNRAEHKPIIDKELIIEIEKTNQIDTELYNILEARFIKQLEKINNKSTKLKFLKTTNRLKEVYDKIKSQ
ncbi:sulfotransferase family protein [Vicingaceae bacterium]|nr:sulfotransferase family protein [Vicingaceae bacterium]